MGKRFSRCLLFSSNYSVADTEGTFGSEPLDQCAMEAIAISLDDDESKNPGLILHENNEV
jgi:hypothetical protein